MTTKLSNSFEVFKFFAEQSVDAPSKNLNSTLPTALEHPFQFSHSVPWDESADFCQVEHGTLAVFSSYKTYLLVLGNKINIS